MDEDLLLGAGGGILLGMVLLIGGRNMLRRGRGGEMSQQGSAAVVMGFAAIVLSIAVFVQFLTGVPFKRAVIISLIGLLTSAATAVTGGSVVKRRLTKKKTLAAKLTDAAKQGHSILWNQFLNQVSPQDFEQFALWLFSQDGYQVTPTGGTGDQGIDLAMERDGMTHVAQCKRYLDRKVGSPELRDFYGALVDAGADFGYFLTTSEFTEAAQRFARNKPIELMDRDSLARYAQQWLKFARESIICSYCDTENRPGASFCRSCGAPMKR